MQKEFAGGRRRILQGRLPGYLNDNAFDSNNAAGRTSRGTSQMPALPLGQATAPLRLGLLFLPAVLKNRRDAPPAE